MIISHRPAVLLLLLLGVDNGESRISSTPETLSSVSSVPREQQGQYERYAQEESPCLTSFEMEIEGPCDVASLTTAVTAALTNLGAGCLHDVAKELSLLFPEGADQAATTACAAAASNALSFSSLSGENSDLFDKEYFDGGTKYNADTPHTDELDVPTNILANDLSILRIKTLHDTIISDTPVALPYGSNFESCGSNTIMCCFTSDRDSNDESQGHVESNTDVCYHELKNSPGSNHVEDGYVIYGGTKEENGALCHGFTTFTPEHSVFAGNLLYHVSLYQHLALEGHVRNIPGSPMCACIEQMATVEKADCTQIESGGKELKVLFSYDSFADGDKLEAKVLEYSPLVFGPCVEGGNGLEDHYAAASIGHTEDMLSKHIVGEGNCESATDKFLLLTQGIQRKASATTITRL
uniref:Uncharacterized protein n=1 Tax=Helicotheca tamesis TaxID=374047 RepID=A0A7S2N1R4_9STRA|mmetsp:Transcript_8020/g.11038  ORF Transcript_8020/g.11038 Transcript_8020/m.11038 type:complete len:410 (+) Transcript_8020:62-1291(+)